MSAPGRPNRELALQAATLRDATPPRAVHAGAGRHGAAALGPLGGQRSGDAASVGAVTTGLRTRVKICGITERDHGLAAARAGADAIGLVFWAGTPRKVSLDRAAGIAAAMPPFVSLVGLFVDPDAAQVRAALAAVPLDVLQFHGSEPPEFCRSFGRPYLKAIAVGDGLGETGLLECAQRYGDAAGLLFDAPPADGMPGGTGRTFAWGALSAPLCARLARPVVLSGGLHPGNVGAAVRAVRPWAVDVSSGVEAIGPDGAPAKGIKDPERIHAFIEEVRHADD
jgi:phosphoribosylanthranilate isomerase